MHPSKLNNTSASSSTQQGEAIDDTNQSSSIDLFITEFNEPLLSPRRGFLYFFCGDILRAASLTPKSDNRDDLLAIYHYVAAFSKIYDTQHPHDQFKVAIKIAASAINRLSGQPLQTIPAIDIRSLLSDDKEGRLERFSAICGRAALIRDHELIEAKMKARGQLKLRESGDERFLQWLDACFAHLYFSYHIICGCPIKSFNEFSGVLKYVLNHINIKTLNEQHASRLFTVIDQFMPMMSNYNQSGQGSVNDMKQLEKIFKQTLSDLKMLIDLPNLTMPDLLKLISYCTDFYMTVYRDQLDKFDICEIFLNKTKEFESIWTEDDKRRIKFVQDALKYSRIESCLGLFLADLSNDLTSNSVVETKKLTLLMTRLDEYLTLSLVLRPTSELFNLDNWLLKRLSGFVHRLLKLTKQTMPADLVEYTARFESELNDSERNLESSLAYYQCLSSNISAGLIKGSAELSRPGPKTQKQAPQRTQVSAVPFSSSSMTIIEPAVEEMKPDECTHQFERFVTELYQRAEQLNKAFVRYQNNSDQSRKILKHCQQLDNIKAESLDLYQSTVSEEVVIAQIQNENAVNEARKTYHHLFFKQLPLAQSALNDFNAAYQSFERWISDQTGEQWCLPIYWDQSVFIDAAKLSYFEYFYTEHIDCDIPVNRQLKAEKLINYLMHNQAPLTKDYIAVIKTLALWANQTVVVPACLIELLKQSAPEVIQQALTTDARADLLSLLDDERRMGDGQAIDQKLKELNIFQCLEQTVAEHTNGVACI